jgi:hypothetical protein
MFNRIAPVTNHVQNNRAKYAAAISFIAGVKVTNRVHLWKEFLSDPETFNQNHPAPAN